MRVPLSWILGFLSLLCASGFPSLCWGALQFKKLHPHIIFQRDQKGANPEVCNNVSLEITNTTPTQGSYPIQLDVYHKRSQAVVKTYTLAQSSNYKGTWNEKLNALPIGVHEFRFYSVNPKGLTYQSVDLIKCGIIIGIGGQSNATGAGTEDNGREKPLDDGISMFTVMGDQWEKANPITNIQSDAATRYNVLWFGQDQTMRKATTQKRIFQDRNYRGIALFLANALRRYFLSQGKDMPVGFFSFGVGGLRISSWYRDLKFPEPGQHSIYGVYFSMLRQIGFKYEALAWIHGETDAALSTPNYRMLMQYLFYWLRLDAGDFQLPIFLAQTGHTKTVQTLKYTFWLHFIQLDQLFMNSEPNTYLVPFYGLVPNDHIHIGGDSAEAAAERFAKTMIEQLYQKVGKPSAPQFEKYYWSGAREVTLQFKNTRGGLKSGVTELKEHFAFYELKILTQDFQLIHHDIIESAKISGSDIILKLKSGTSTNGLFLLIGWRANAPQSTVLGQPSTVRAVIQDKDGNVLPVQEPISF